MATGGSWLKVQGEGLFLEEVRLVLGTFGRHAAAFQDIPAGFHPVLWRRAAERPSCGGERGVIFTVESLGFRGSLKVEG